MKNSNFKKSSMRNAIIFTIFTVLIAGWGTGCKKDEPKQQKDCEIKNLGYFRFFNHTSDLYIIVESIPNTSYVDNIIVDNVWGDGGLSSWYHLQAGKNYYFKVQAGALAPIIKTYNIYLNQCDSLTINIY